MWNSILEVFRAALAGLHQLLEPVAGANAWGWAIVALTLAVRILLLPLAIKQTRSMRAMQALQPKIRALQEKHKATRDLARADPEEYRRRVSKLNEETMALYRSEGVNPASGCLPLLLQLPVFFALFSVLRTYPDLQDAPFYFFTSHVTAAEGAARGLGALIRQAGWPGWLLIGLMAVSTFVAQRQTIAKSAAMPESALTQQKVMLYVMPFFLVFVSFGLPIGVMLYWVTTNLWQIGQQAVSLREVKTHPGVPDDPRHPHSRAEARAAGVETAKPKHAEEKLAAPRKPAGGKKAKGKKQR
ncbi:MAG: YidC/Oxa1 family membrane protein insertase [Myxococcales bacterium]|jgi:YidC/Oxa1 family membrane protein insertase